MRDLPPMAIFSYSRAEILGEYFLRKRERGKRGREGEGEGEEGRGGTSSGKEVYTTVCYASRVLSTVDGAWYGIFTLKVQSEFGPNLPLASTPAPVACRHTGENI
jgi:hypothetical protein